MKNILLLLFLCCSLIIENDFAQDMHKIDSLQNELKKFEVHKKELGSKATALMDSTMVNIFYEIIKLYWENNHDKAMEYAQQCLTLSEKIGYKKGIGIAYNCMGVINYQKGNYKQALEYYQKAQKVGIESCDTKGIADSYNNIGIIYDEQGNYPAALKNYLAALTIYKEIGCIDLSAAYINIGLIEQELGNYPEALKNDLASLKICEEIGNKQSGIALSYNNIGAIYQEQSNYLAALKNYSAALKIYEEIGDTNGIAMNYRNTGHIYAEQGKYPEALKNQLASLKICEGIGSKNGIADSYYNIGDIYCEESNYPEALKNYLNGVRIFQEVGNKDAIAASDIGIGVVFEKQGNYLEALKYETKALSIALEIGAKNHIKDAYGKLAEINSKLNNFKAAYNNEVLFKQVYDTLFSKENEEKFTSLQMQYEFDKQESLAKAEQEKKDAIALKELQKQKLVRNGFMGGFAVVVLFGGVVSMQRNRIRKGKKLSDELLLNILPSEVAEELKQKGSAEAKHFDDVTVMFTDFKDFTEISEKLSPAELVAEIDTCFKAFDNITGKYNIEKIKTIGDSYMCAGGLPVPNKTNATDVVSAALEIQKFMGEHSLQKIKEGKKVFELRIGIHSGSVVAGIVGIKKFAYDIWGNTVNIASRMESSGEAGKVNISGSTYELVKDKFSCTHRGKIEAKHMGMIDMYFVETANPSVL